MAGLREVGLVSAVLAITGGLVFIIWNLLSTREEKSDDVDGTAPNDQTEGTRDTADAEPVLASVISKTLSDAVTDETPPTTAKPRGTWVLVVGLEGVGKTSILHCFTTGVLEQDVTPTEGFNAISINKEELQIEFLEIGGTENLRPYWKKYLSKALMLLFVVDSTDRARFPLAKQHLHDMLVADPHLPLMVLANKQDLPETCSITELHEALDLSAVGEERKLFLIGTSVRKGEELSSGILDARDMVVQLIASE